MATAVTATTTNHSKEIRLNPPKVFNGDRKTFRKFLQDAEVYLLINQEVYDNDLKKIGYVLSFMTEGQAEAWAGQFVETEMAKNVSGTLALGTYSNFHQALVNAFSEYDSPGEALDQMKNLRMKSEDSIEEHIAKFKTMLTISKLDETSAAIIDLFRETLTVPLQRRILTLETPPTTLKDWYDWATKLDYNWRKMQKIIGRSNQGNKGTPPAKKFYFQKKDEKKDPNAMQVDAMTVDKRTKLMKEGRCFTCEDQGHISKDCPKKKKKEEEPKKKTNPKDLYAHVRACFKEMTEEEKEQFYKSAEESGF
jgi:hypothetical protein